jgi:Helix-turn-helix domain
MVASRNLHSAADASMLSPQTPTLNQQDRIEFVDENLRHGFAQMPRPVLKARGLSFRAKCVYNLLLDYAWQTDSCFPGQERLAEDLDTSVDTIQRSLNELKAYGLIDWKRQGLNKPNIYYILRLSECKNLHLNGTPQDCGFWIPQSCGNRTPQICGSNNTQSKNTQKEKDTDSNLRNADAKNSKKEEGRGDTTCSHIDRGTIRKEENTIYPHSSNRNTGASTPSPTHTILKRVEEITQQASRRPPTLPNGYTEEEDAIAAYIEDYSRILNDQAHTRSNARQAINIFTQIKSEIPGLEVEHYLFILETFNDIVKMRANVKNKGAYYFRSLRNHLWPGKQ